MRRLSLLVFNFLFSLICFSPAARGGDLTSPEDFLHFKIGEDRKLADWEQISGYFYLLGSQSERIEVVRIGTSTEGRPLLMAIISAPDNLRRSREIKTAMQQLADPRRLDPANLDHLLDTTPNVLLINCSIHATEIAASQFAMELAHQLAAAEDPEVLGILQDVVVLLLPSSNPDGVDLVARWYRSTVGTPGEGLEPPQLYQKYAGHDNNRDWFMLNLPETRAVTRVLYHEWFPPIVYDLHQMGGTGPRMVVPPFYEITNPLIDQQIVDEAARFGYAMMAELSRAGFSGVISRARFDMWWHGGFRTAPYFHNVVGLLSEAASARLASPDTLSLTGLISIRDGLAALGGSLPGMSRGWSGRIWRLRDIIDMEQRATMAVLKTARQDRRRLLNNFYHMGRRAVETGRRGSPAAFVIPSEQHDPASARKLAEILLAQGIEVERATARFQGAGQTFLPDALIIRTAQPYRANVLALLDVQRYPEQRAFPGGPIDAPYDVTAWSLPAQMGVEVVKIDQLGTVPASSVQPPARWPVAPMPPETGDFLVIDSGSNDAYRFLNTALASGIEVFWNLEPLEAGGKNIPPGCLLLRDSQESRTLLRQALEQQALRIASLRSSGPLWLLQIHPPRVGVYRSAIPEPDEGWTRYVLEDFAIPYESITDADIRRGELASRFDAIILPSMNDSSIVEGFSASSAGARYPDEYCGGIGRIGVANLRDFVGEGGSLLCFGEAVSLGAAVAKQPLEDIVAGRRDFSAPGSLLRVQVDPRDPLAFGMPAECSILFLNNAVFAASGEAAVLRYPQRNILVSGWLKGARRVAGASALKTMNYGSGRVVLYGFRPQHRGQTHGTYKLVFNALYSSAAHPVLSGVTARSEE